CLHKDPLRRYPSAAALADELERWLSGEPITARPAGRAERAWKWARRYPAAAALILALLVGAAGSTAGAWLALLRRDRAVRAEGEARGRLAQSHADAARLAMQRSQWPQALEQLDRAWAAGLGDDVGLRLERVKALEAVHRLDEARSELDAL